MLILGNGSQDDGLILNITPSFPLDVKGYFTANITTYSDNWGNTERRDTILNRYDNDFPLEALITKDVYSVHVSVYRHNSFPSGPKVKYVKVFRVDELILLSIAGKFLKGLPSIS